MLSKPLLPKLFRSLSSAHRPAKYRLAVEPLESRCVLSYMVIDLGSLGGGGSLAWGINNKAEIVGNSRTSTGDDHAFIWRNGVMTDLGTLGGSTSVAYAINNHSQVTGRAFLDGDTNEHAFLWDSVNGMQDVVGTLGGADSAGTGINDSGTLVGQADTISSSYHAFVHPPIADLGTLGTGDKSAARGINSLGQITGGSFTGTASQHAFLWDSGVMMDLGTLGGVVSKAYGINDSTMIVGTSQIGPGAVTHAYRWKADQVPAMQDLGTLGGQNSVARAINSAGIIVGDAQNALGETRAFIYKNNTMIDLNTLIPTASGVVLESSFGINNKGQIIAWGTRFGVGASFLLTRRMLSDVLPPPGDGLPIPQPGDSMVGESIRPVLSRPSAPLPDDQRGVASTTEASDVLNTPQSPRQPARALRPNSLPQLQDPIFVAFSQVGF